jgi:DNA-binding HxlR family transcriptional regulator
VRPGDDSVERALGEVGDHWTFLVLREAFFGVRRFDEIQDRIGVSPAVLAGRLKRLVASGVLERVRYSDRPPRFEYRLTDKGLDLYDVILALVRWGDRWLAGGDPVPLRLEHVCGHVPDLRLRCDGCGEALEARTMKWTSQGVGDASTAER